MTGYLAGLLLAIWIYLIGCHGGFWRASVRDDRGAPTVEPTRWPSVVAIIPARNEVEMAPRSMASLLAQDYPGPFSIIVVDDNSEDGTAAAIKAAAAHTLGRVRVLGGALIAPGWTGKLWAQSQGIADANNRVPPPEYLLLTDADIVYAPHTLRGLVTRAEAGGLVLTSLMARLRCESLAERALIPAFIFFFQMLYPFKWVNRLSCSTAAAAGGCMLVRPASLAAAGGLGRIKDAVIDDCALGAVLKTEGPIWLGLTNSVVSIRPYPAFGDIRRMVARSAYAQLKYSWIILAGALLGLIVTFLAAPLIAIFGSGPSRLAALAGWILMALAFLPTLRFYRLSPLWAPLLPAIAAVYVAFTLDSAYQHMRGRGGMWKGRAQALSARVR